MYFKQTILERDIFCTERWYSKRKRNPFDKRKSFIWYCVSRRWKHQLTRCVWIQLSFLVAWSISISLERGYVLTLSIFSYLAIDLAILTLADHSILSYGTFGMWGSLLSNSQETIIPKIALKSHVGAKVNEAVMKYNLTSWKFLWQIMLKLAWWTIKILFRHNC